MFMIRLNETIENVNLHFYLFIFTIHCERNYWCISSLNIKKIVTSILDEHLINIFTIPVGFVNN